MEDFKIRMLNVLQRILLVNYSEYFMEFDDVNLGKRMLCLECGHTAYPEAFNHAEWCHVGQMVSLNNDLIASFIESRPDPLVAKQLKLKFPTEPEQLKFEFMAEHIEPCVVEDPFYSGR